MLRTSRPKNKSRHLFSLAMVGAMLLGYVCLGYLGFLVYLDLRIPISNISAVALNSPIAGGIARLEFTYSRDHIPLVIVEERWLSCEDGTQFSPESAEGSTSAWPAGENVKAILNIRIPERVQGGQHCFYASMVRYPRYILPDRILRIPPVDVEIAIARQ